MYNGNKKKYVDLHIHSTYSDSSLTVTDIVECASKKGLAAISLTDHDCVAGISEMAEIAKGVSLEIISGIELSSMYEDSEVHILGYFLDINDAKLLAKLEEIRILRLERAKTILNRLKADDIVIRFEKLMEFATGFSIGRPHIAQALMAEEYVDSYNEAFDKYLGNNTKYYLPVHKLPPKDAIKIIHDAGGIAIMAHPHVTSRDDIIPELVKDGLDGLEVYHPRHPYKTYQHYCKLCYKHRILETGGSDCHGHHYGDLSLGMLKIPQIYVTKMKEVVANQKSLVN